MRDKPTQKATTPACPLLLKERKLLMSKNAKKLIRQAIKLIGEEDGASPVGCYRDVVTEVLHLANKRFRTGAYSGIDMLRHWICSMGFEAFQEELEIIEMGKVNAIPDSELPLHTITEFQFLVCRTQFEERLKTGDKYYGKKVPALHSLRKKNRKGNKTP
jgi:hypothetical protein